MPKTRFLIVGLGSIGRRHLRNLINLGQNDIILYRTHLSTLSDDELNVFPVEHDLDKALARKPDAVIISNPTALHLDVAIPAAKAGCHLFIEKPLSNNLDRIHELIESIEEKSIEVFVAFQFRFHPGLRIIKQLINEKIIGRIIYVRSQWSEYLPNWHPWEDYRKGYSARRDLGGGVVLTLCHPIDYLLWLFGEVEQLNAAVEKLSDLEIQVEDSSEVILYFKSGILGSLHLDFIQQPPQHILEITGTEGIIKWNNSDGAVHLYKNSSANWEIFSIAPDFERNDMFLEEMRHFIEVVDGTSKPICTLNDGIQVQKMVDAIFRSSKNGTRISIN